MSSFLARDGQGRADAMFDVHGPAAKAASAKGLVGVCLLPFLLGSVSYVTPPLLHMPQPCHSVQMRLGRAELVRCNDYIGISCLSLYFIQP